MREIPEVEVAMLGEIFQRFVEKSPIAVMVRGLLERVLGAEALDAWYEQTAQKQYTRTLEMIVKSCGSEKHGQGFLPIFLRLHGVRSEHHRRTVHLHAPRVADACHSACAGEIASVFLPRWEASETQT
jgi:hypothetical protein